MHLRVNHGETREIGSIQGGLPTLSVTGKSWRVFFVSLGDESFNLYNQESSHFFGHLHPHILWRGLDTHFFELTLDHYYWDQRGLVEI